MQSSIIEFHLDKSKFWEATPFPHLIIDNFLPEEFALEILSVFPGKKDVSWTPYIHFNEYKYGCSDYAKFPFQIKKLFDELLNEKCCEKLSLLLDTKIHADPKLIGGGLHQTFRKGFLNVHTDFSHHPHNNSWKRKLNLIIYFNQDWPESYFGDLELWDKNTKQCVQSIAPSFNRAVLFLTNENSLHGSPQYLNCQKDESRKSIALYYYETTEEKQIKATKYYSLSENPLTRLIITSENSLLMIFTWLRRVFKINH